MAIPTEPIGSIPRTHRTAVKESRMRTANASANQINTPLLGTADLSAHCADPSALWPGGTLIWQNKAKLADDVSRWGRF
jgi:hypothetical protein